MSTASFANFTCDQFAETLADFLEREVDEPTRATMETHALACAACGTLLADLRKLRIDAANLPELEPARDLWAGIADRIETPVVELPATRPGARSPAHGGSANRRVHRWITLGLAAAALVIVTATVTHEITKRSVSNVGTVSMAPVIVKPTAPATLATSPETAVVAAAPARERAPGGVAHAPNRRLVSNTKPSIDETYNSEISKLRAIVNQHRSALDSSTVAVIDKNLKIIDDAIANCRAALKKDPSSRFLNESLNDALDSKVQLLRTAAGLPTRM